MSVAAHSMKENCKKYNTYSIQFLSQKSNNNEQRKMIKKHDVIVPLLNMKIMQLIVCKSTYICWLTTEERHAEGV